MSVPTTKKEVCSLIGLCSYYRRFVPNFSSVLAPLTDLTKKGASSQVHWTPKCHRAFETLQAILNSHPVLILPNFQSEFILRTDASNKGLGAVLLQDLKGLYHPVCYISRKLLSREINYSVMEKECLSIVWAVDKLSKYLHGRCFILETDHKPLVYLNTARFRNPRIARWALYLQQFKFRTRSITGLTNLGADILSRCPLAN